MYIQMADAELTRDLREQVVSGTKCPGDPSG
jgi:hypothetical protein